MKFKKQPLYLLLVASLLHGCSTTSQGIKEEFSFTEQPNIGLYAFALRWDRRCEKNHPLLPVHATAYIKGGKESHLINVENSFLKSDFENPLGYFFIFGTEPGERKLDQVTLIMDHNNYKISFDPITFNVYKGKLNYIGELNIKAENCRMKIIRNFESPVGDAKVNIVDQWERDKIIISNRLKNIDQITIEKELMKQ